jgi:hypothetical protein
MIYARVDDSYTTYDSIIPTNIAEKQNGFFLLMMY